MRSVQFLRHEVEESWMRTHALRRSMVVVLIGCVLSGGCTRSTLKDRVAGPSGGASSSTTAEPSGGATSTTAGGSTTSGPGSTTGSSTASSTAPGNVITLDQGRPGSVLLPDGARVTVPEGAVTSPTAQLRLAGDAAGTHTVAVDGTIQGAAEVRLPAGTTDPARQSFVLV